MNDLSERIAISACAAVAAVMAIAGLDFDESQHPRDDHGKFGEGGGSSAKSATTKAGKARTSEPTQTPLTKSQIAKQSASRVDKVLQRYCEEKNEARVAAAIGGAKVPDLADGTNAPADIAKKPPPTLVELKTIVTNKHGDKAKLTMDRYAQVRKVNFEKEHGSTFHTTASDDRAVIDANGPGQHDESKRVYYYRRGIAGSARIAAMQKCNSIDEVKKFMAMPEKDLPPAAQRTDQEIRKGAWKPITDKQGRGFKNSKSGEIVRPKP